MRLLLLLPLLFAFSILFAQDTELEVEGGIKIGDVQSAPDLGTIRYNPATNDFEGYTGSWTSLTKVPLPSGSHTVSDIDGNVYLTITIGTQVWMRENLRVSKYNDGTSIPETTLNTDWEEGSPGWCWYDNDPKHELSVGKLYNWFAVDSMSNGNKNLCPTGWHVPNDSEWVTLANFLGGFEVAGGKMKSTGTIEAGTGLWRDPNAGATNESAFTAQAGGFRNDNGVFLNLSSFGYWWSRTAVSPSFAVNRVLHYDIDDVSVANNSKANGYSVRCVKD